MMKQYNRVCARIDLDAIEYNMEMMHKNTREGVSMISVIKTDGYGHGAVQIARMLEPKDYIWGYAVATLDEAVVLRKRGIKKPILVLGCIFPDQWEAAITHEIRFTVYTKEMAEGISELAGKLGKDAYVHIKLDTGMSRLGFLIQEESAEIITGITRLPGLIMEGMFTHFAKADETDKTFTKQQLEAYRWMTERLKEEGVDPQYRHCSNSAGIIDVPEANMDLVRAGIALYGLYPSEEVDKNAVPLKPSLSLLSHVVHTKWIDKGEVVSYGGCFTASRPTKVATVPVGYADGYPRSLSDKGYVLIHGKKAPLLGRVCMDQFMVDVTDIDDVKFMDPVTLVGTDGEETIEVEDLSALSGRFNYEFLCNLDKRIPREYTRHGKVIAQMDYFA